MMNSHILGYFRFQLKFFKIILFAGDLDLCHLSWKNNRRRLLAEIECDASHSVRTCHPLYIH